MAVSRHPARLTLTSRRRSARSTRDPRSGAQFTARHTYLDTGSRCDNTVLAVKQHECWCNYVDDSRLRIL